MQQADIFKFQLRRFLRDEARLCPVLVREDEYLAHSRFEPVRAAGQAHPASLQRVRPQMMYRERRVLSREYLVADQPQEGGDAAVDAAGILVIDLRENVAAVDLVLPGVAGGDEVAVLHAVAELLRNVDDYLAGRRLDNGTLRIEGAVVID